MAQPTIVLGPPTELDDELIRGLIYDVAHRIHTYDTIARRYGFIDVADMKAFLNTHPQIVKEAQRLRAIVDGDQSAELRTRLKAAFATEDLIVPMAAICADGKIPPGTRIDAFKQLSRVAGIDGMPATAKDGAAAGTQFSLTINMPDGRTEKIITSVVDPPNHMLLEDAE